MHIQLLGPVRVSALRSGTPHLLPSAKMRHLLALLAWKPNSFVSDDEAVAHIWGEEHPKDPRATLYTWASRLRRHIGTVTSGRPGPDGPLVRRDGGYMLLTDPSDVDVHELRRLVRASRAARHAGRVEEAYELLDDALGRACGVPLADLSSPWADRARWSMELELLTARLQHAQLALASGRCQEVLAVLVELADRHPLDEAVAEILIRALYLAGRQADALGRYRLTRTVLVDQLGQEPGPALRDLHDMVLRRDPVLSQAAADPGC
ncbi:AfsR/SARP family transcriptional regulator [Streptomyces sp. NPDC004126]|uniref:AfsR/SARP family transcriptional regulator n=1 Tax=Streptomyces sp. NPDC004126 TaxID=3390695 RepID=UPI003D052915